MQQDGSNLINSILSKFCHEKTCAFWWYSARTKKEAIGTANVVRYQGKFFILTCKHVADAAFAADSARLIFHDHPAVDRQCLIYLDKTTDELDMALIGFSTEQAFHDFHDIAALASVEDFSSHPFEDECLHIYGYPGEYAESAPGQRKFQGFSFMTNPHGTVQSTKDFLYCEYPAGLDEIDTSHASKRLPAPYGLSGSFIFLVEGFREEKPIWAADGSSGIVAMQSATFQQADGGYKYLKGVNVSHGMAMLEKTKK